MDRITALLAGRIGAGVIRHVRGTAIFQRSLPAKTFALLLAFLLPPVAAAETFKIATILPDGTRWMEAMRGGAEEIAKRTDGRVKFRFYPGGVMGNDQTVLRKIKLGQLHGGAITGGGLASVYPDAQIYGLPFLFANLDEVDHVRARMDAVLLKGIEQQGFVSFGFSEAGFAYFMSDDPLSTVDDLRRQKVWIPDGDEISRATLEAMQIAPISLPLTDVLAGLETGLIDTVAASPIGAIALQWHSRVRHLADLPLMYIYGTMILDQRRFARLTPADQAITREVMGRVFETLNAENRVANRQAREALAEQGIAFAAPTDAEAWVTGVNAAIEDLGRKGVFTTDRMNELRIHLDRLRHGG